MSTTTPTRFGPYSTRDELHKGRRKALLSLTVAVVAVVLAVFASRTVEEPRLVVVYLLAGGMHFAASLAASIRWSRTPEFEPVD
jgi:hypoxanthine-guanine phosphoribosyltransferase